MSRLDQLRAMRDFIDSEIEALLAEEIQQVRRDLTVQRISQLYNVRVDDVLLGIRRHDVTRARHAMTWALHEQGASLTDLARVFGYRGPSSVCVALRRVNADQAMRTLLTGLKPRQHRGKKAG